MKKKLLCMLFALLMSLSFAACGSDDSQDTAGGDKSDFEAFMEVQKNMEGVKDMEFKMDMKTEVPSEDGNFNMTLEGAGKEILKAKDDVQMEMQYTMDTAGTKVDGTMYMKDQAFYMDLMGQKMKMDASNEMSALVNVDTNNLFAITEEMISDLKVSKEGSDTVFNFTMDANKALDYFAKNAGGGSGITESTEGLTFDKMDVTVVAGADKMAKSIAMSFVISTDVDGETTTMNYEMTMEYLSLNTDLKIDFPDFSDYQEMTV